MAIDARQVLLRQKTKTYAAWYNGKMSYSLFSKSWQDYVADMVEKAEQTPENFFKAVIDLYAEALQPDPEELKGFGASVVPLLCRGEALCVLDNTGAPHFAEHYEVLSDGDYTIAAVFTRSLATMMDYCTFAWSDGSQELWGKPVPDDLTPATRDGYQYIESSKGALFRFALPDRGLGALLAPTQDRINHSVVDQTLVGEMYARPFWYLLKYQKPVTNPYLEKEGDEERPVRHQKAGSDMPPLFTTSSEGPFGQLSPSDLTALTEQHERLIARMSQVSGVPGFYLNPSSGDVPTGAALKQLSARFNKKVGRYRDALEPQLNDLAALLGVDADANLWPEGDDLLQEAMDAHGLALTTMGYPLDYIAEVVTPGVDLDDYRDDGYGEMTPDQIAAYAATPGQLAGQPQGVTINGDGANQ